MSGIYIIRISESSVHSGSNSRWPFNNKTSGPDEILFGPLLRVTNLTFFYYNCVILKAVTFFKKFPCILACAYVPGQHLNQTDPFCSHKHQFIYSFRGQSISLSSLDNILQTDFFLIMFYKTNLFL